MPLLSLAMPLLVRTSSRARAAGVRGKAPKNGPEDGAPRC